MAEVRITDPTTGGQKGQKPAQLGALDPLALMAVAEVAGFGGIKYERYNYARGFAWSLSYDALQRHLHAFWGGENNDPESGLPHVAHAAWHCLALLCFSLRGRGTDDRFPAAVPLTVAAVRALDASEHHTPEECAKHDPGCAAHLEGVPRCDCKHAGPDLMLDGTVPVRAHHVECMSAACKGGCVMRAGAVTVRPDDEIAVPA